MAAKVIVAHYGAPATAALAAEIASVQKHDPLAPVTVAVPSNYAGLSLRRQLGRNHALVNVRFLALARVGELLGAPALAAAGQVPLTKWIRAEAVLAALAAHLADNPASILADVDDHPATGEGLERTLGDLREADDAALSRLERQGPRPSEVVAIYRRYRAITAGRYYDTADLATSAAHAVENAPGLRDIGHVIVFLARTLTAAEVHLVHALGAVGGATVILGKTGQNHADSALNTLQNALAQAPQRPGLFDKADPTPIPAATHIVAVTDAQEEIRTVVRMATERARAGQPLHRMAVLYPSRETYAAAVHELLSAADIPHNGPAVTTLAQSVTGRFLGGLLRLPADGFRRDALFDWLTSAPVLEPGRGPAPTGWWDTISREANVVSGVNEWQLRLEVFVRSIDASLADTERPPSEGKIRKLKLQQSLAPRLAAFVQDLADRLSPSGLTTWKQHAAWVRNMLEDYLGAIPDDLVSDGGGVARQPAARDEVLAQLDNLEALDAVTADSGIPRVITRNVFTRALERALQSPATRIEKFGHGMFTGTFADAAGMAFDTVFVLGVVEGQVPAIGRDDPLLPDRERRAVSTLPLHSTRRDEEWRDYLAALATATERILFFPGADLGGQRKHLPSRWLLGDAARLRQSASGQPTTSEPPPLSTEDFLELPPQPWLSRAASFQQAVEDPTREPGSGQEYDLRLLAGSAFPGSHPLASALPQIGRGIAAVRARRGTLSEFDGLIGAREGLLPAVTSPTALEIWATCPYKYFLRNVLGVSEQEEPEAILVMTPAERGTLIHDALERFMNEHAGWRAPWNDTHRERLAAIGEELCDEAEASGIAGKPLLWALERDRIRRDLQGFLDADSDRATKDGRFFRASEHAFGNTNDAYPPVTVALEEGRNVGFRGRIDRVDQRPADGSLAIYDYKTGGSTQFKRKAKDPDFTHAGVHLQLPVYALAAEAAFGSGRPVAAKYWFVTHAEQYQFVGGLLDAGKLAHFRRQLRIIADGIERGQFPANPGSADIRPGGRSSGSANCQYCPYDRICARDRQRAWERHQGEPAIVEYLRLAGTADGADDDAD